jgi:3-oxoacyl-[acyl-carrier protein] reductase
MTGKLTEELKEKLFARIPLARMGSTEEIANAALFLASDLSTYLTGQTLSVDGGMFM